MRFFKFVSNGFPVNQDQCTTVWPDSISCNIPMAGMVGSDYINIMVMDGDNTSIANWANENVGKIFEMTLNETNALGLQMCPVGTKTKNPDGSEMVSTGFDVLIGVTWS